MNNVLIVILFFHFNYGSSTMSSIMGYANTKYEYTDLHSSIISSTPPYTLPRCLLYCLQIRVITKLPNTEQSSKGKVKTHKSTNRQNQSTTGKLGKPQPQINNINQFIPIAVKTIACMNGLYIA